jgi:cAMP-dependent protein kinase regulator
LLQDLEPYERNKICDVLNAETYKDGDYIIKQGDVGDKFYFIEEGHAIATKSENGKSSQVFEYKENDYFGELSLLKD